MDDFLLDWSHADGLIMEGTISGGVPIPRHQQQSQLMDHMHSNASLLSRALHSNSGITTSVSSERFIEGGGVTGSPYQQNCSSPVHQPYQQSPSPISGMNNQLNQNNTGFRTHNDSISYQENYNSMGLSPLPTNSPSPHMWQTQSMDLDGDMLDIKLEPLEILGKDNLLQYNGNEQNFIADEFDLLGHEDEGMMYQGNYLDEIIPGGSMNDPTCLDPQHSSPAAMAAVRPNEVMGIGPHSSSHSAGSGNSVSSLSRLVIHSSELKPDMNFQENQDRIFLNNQNDVQQHQLHSQVQHSQSFTDSSFLNATMGGGASSGLLSGGTVKIEPTMENTDSFVASSFPPNSAWRDSFMNNSSATPKFQQSTAQDLGSSQTFIVNRNSSPGPSSSLPFRDQPADSIEQLLRGNNRPHISQSTPNSIVQTQQQQQLQSSQGPQMNSVQQNYVLQNHQQAQLHKLQQPSSFIKREDQFPHAVKNFDQHSMHLSRHFHQHKPLSPTQQLVHQQKQQIPLKTSPQQQIPMAKDVYASSFPSTPNNTPVQSGLFIGSTLKEILQSPTSTASPISPQSASSPISSSSPLPVCSPGTANSPRMTQSPFHSTASPSNPLTGFDDPQSFVPVGHSVPTNNMLSSQFPSGSSNASRVRLQNSLQFTHNNQLSSSAPAPNMLEQIWGRREPRKHLLSTGSLAEEQFGGSSSSLGLPSPAPELSIDESCLDSDDESEINYDSDSDNETVMGNDTGQFHTSGGSGSNNSSNSNRSKERHFWQYNVQAKGPKGQRVSLEPHLTDPHQLVTVADPVFSEDVCSVQGIKHSGKARRGDGNDLSPNPSKLVDIGKQLSGLNKTIMDMTPVSEQPFHIRPKSRKEKNKLASRACRLKKKAQHEANKIKLYGLGEEHKYLLLQIRQCRAILAKKYLLSAESSNDNEITRKHQLQLTDRLCSVASTKPFQIAGQTTDFVNNVIDKCRRGRSNGGLDELTQCLDGLRTSGTSYCESGGDGGGGGRDGGGLETVTDYMAEFA